MPGSLPEPPRYDRWPLTLQHAMRLRGALVPCGPGMRGLAWPDSAAVRLTSVGPWLGQGKIAALLTAAWVWGAAKEPGQPLSIAVQAGQHGGRIKSGARRYELRLAPDDIVTLGEFSATAPTRTIIDLLYRPAPFHREEAQACQGLLTAWPQITATVTQYVCTHRRPHSRLARERFTQILDNT